MPGRHVLAAVAWPYASGPRHIGHVAGFGVPSDVHARYRRLAGDRVLMVSGTDEHGTPILVRADAESTTPQEVADRYNRVIVEDLAGLGLSYDLFTRTTTANHAAVAQDVFRALHANGYVVAQTQLGAIDPSTGRTLPDRYIEGTCPICGYTSARGDQCDSCGNQLDPVDLIEPRSKIDGATPAFVETEHFFLDLPAFAEALGEWLGSREGWRPNVLNFSRNLVADLRPRPITRDLDWGVPVPLEGWADRPDKRLYVWFDAVIGYLSASVEWARRQGDPDAWRAWWRPDGDDVDARYFMGKDNVVFHTVIWPALLLGTSGSAREAAPPSVPGEPGAFGGLRLPDEVVSSEFLTMEGRKFSSSRSVVIYVRDVLDRYGPDALRYYICVSGPETADTDFTWAEFVTRVNTELIGAWGNLVNRLVGFTREERRVGAGAGRARRGRPGAAAPGRGGVRRGGRALRRKPAQGGGGGGDAAGRGGQRLPEPDGVLVVGEDRPGADACGVRDGVAGDRRLRDAAGAGAAAQQQQGAPDARRSRSPEPAATGRRGDRPRRRARVPGDHGRLRVGGGRAGRGRVAAARAGAGDAAGEAGAVVPQAGPVGGRR